MAGRVLENAHQHQRDLGQTVLAMFRVLPEPNERSGVFEPPLSDPVKGFRRDVPFGRTVPV